MESEAHPRVASPSPASHQRFAAMVEPHLPALRAFVDRRHPSLTDDVMSEVGVVAWRRLNDLPRGHERAWLFGVARTALLAEQRRATARHAAELGGDSIDDLTSDDRHGRTTSDFDPTRNLSPRVAAPLAQALDTLSPRDRELLLLTAWEGLSTAEAAHVLTIRPTAARMALVRARRRLAIALDDLDPGWRPHSATRSTNPQEVPSCADARP